MASSVYTMVMSLLLSTLTPSATTTDDNSIWKDILKGAPPIQYSSLSGPSFTNTTTTSVRAVSGTTATLPCGIRNLHNYTVSWVQGSDIRLLTTKALTYTSDTRFVSVNPGGGEQWVLKIHYVRKGDGGSYLCQVSTTPPITIIVNLTVHEAVATVEPSTEVYVQSGSRLEVICEVKGCPPPAFLSWTRGERTVHTSQPINSQEVDQNVMTPVSRLALYRPRATHSHSGTYTCTSACTLSINVTVHVLKGEELAAMQHHNTARPTFPPSSTLAWSLMVSAAVLILTRSWTHTLYRRPPHSQTASSTRLVQHFTPSVDT